MNCKCADKKTAEVGCCFVGGWKEMKIDHAARAVPTPKGRKVAPGGGKEHFARRGWACEGFPHGDEVEKRAGEERRQKTAKGAGGEGIAVQQPPFLG